VCDTLEWRTGYEVGFRDPDGNLAEEVEMERKWNGNVGANPRVGGKGC